MAGTRIEHLGRWSLGGAAVAAAGCAAYLWAGGTRLGAPFVCVVLAMLSLCFVLYLLGRSALAVAVERQVDEVRAATGRRRKELEREKQLLLKALKELSFDHEMRKVSTADFEEMSAAYRARAVRILRQLDESAATYRKEIEGELAQRRGDAASSSLAAAASSSSPLAASAAASPSSSPPSGGVVAGGAPDGARAACAGCGADNEGDAVFCKKCGRRVAAGEGLG